MPKIAVGIMNAVFAWQIILAVLFSYNKPWKLHVLLYAGRSTKVRFLSLQLEKSSAGKYKEDV